MVFLILFSSVSLYDTSLTNKQRISKLPASQGWIKQYITKVHANVIQCVVCKKLLKMPAGMYGNMRRHFRTQHPYIYARERNEFTLDDGKSDKRGTVDKSSRKKLPVIVRSWLRQYMTKISTDLYSCHVCLSKLKLQDGSLSNMRRHFKTQHPDVYEKERNKVYIEDIADKEENKSQDQRMCADSVGEEKVNKPEIDLNKVDALESDNTNCESDTESEAGSKTDALLCMSDPDIETKIKLLCQKKRKGKSGKALTCFWNFFNHIRGNIYSCSFCGLSMPCFQQSVGNLRRHMSNKHKEAYTLALKYISEKDSGMRHLRKSDELNKDDIWESIDETDFETLEDGFKCKICDTVLTNVEDGLKLFEHIKDNHPDNIVLHSSLPIFDDEQMNVVVVG